MLFTNWEVRIWKQYLLKISEEALGHGCLRHRGQIFLRMDRPKFNLFSNTLVIHEGNTNEISTMTVTLYLIKFIEY